MPLDQEIVRIGGSGLVGIALGGWTMAGPVDLYTTTYGHFQDTVLAEVRRETYGEDIGQNSWLTADEYREFLGWLQLRSGSLLLDIGCGSGGPALFAASATGARVVGIDASERAIATANDLARARQLDSLVRFERGDAARRLPFPDASFDAVICIDAINHLPNRLGILAEWRRVLRAGGRMLYTDPIIVTGILSNEEIATRSSIGYFLFTPVGENERLISEAGCELLRSRDATENCALVAERWQAARARRREALIGIEGAAAFEGLQRFLSMVQHLSSERRLSRSVFLARKPDTAADPVGVR